MLIRPIFALTVLGAFCGFVSAAGAPAAPHRRTDAREVRAWLMRIHEAAGKRNFQGTFVVSGGGAVSSSRIAHFCEGSNQYERIESLDGQARHVFRHNDVVHTVWPASRVALVEQRAVADAASRRCCRPVTTARRVLRSATRRAASALPGREANVLLVQPRDALRFGYRLWADKASGLLLRADVLGERGEVLESSAFSEVTIGVKPQPDSVLRADEASSTATASCGRR